MSRRHRHQAGKLRTLCQIEAHNGAVSTRGAKDNDAANWISQGETWASIEPLTGREAEHAQQLHANASHRVELRYHPSLAIGPHHRLRVKGTSRLLNLGSALDVDERRRKVRCTAAEEVSPWTPAELSPSIWLHAGDLSATLEDADPVATWADRSGNGVNFTQGAAGATFEAGELPGVVFDGSGYLWNESDPALADYGAWLLVATPSGAADQDVAAACYDHQPAESGTLAVGFDVYEPHARYAIFSPPGAGASFVPDAVAGRTLLGIDQTAAGATVLRYDDADLVSLGSSWPWTAATYDSPPSPMLMSLGGAKNASIGGLARGFTGKLHELLVFNDWHDPEKIEQAARDLRRRWQID